MLDGERDPPTDHGVQVCHTDARPCITSNAMAAVTPIVHPWHVCVVVHPGRDGAFRTTFRGTSFDAYGCTLCVDMDNGCVLAILLVFKTFSTLASMLRCVKTTRIALPCSPLLVRQTQTIGEDRWQTALSSIFRSPRWMAMLIHARDPMVFSPSNVHAPAVCFALDLHSSLLRCDFDVFHFCFTNAFPAFLPIILNPRIKGDPLTILLFLTFQPREGMDRPVHSDCTLGWKVRFSSKIIFCT